MSKGLPQLLTLSLLGAAIIVLIGIGLESGLGGGLRALSETQTLIE